MAKRRVIARIDIKNESVIKGIQFDGLRKLGDPNEFAKRYYNSGIDEIIFMDAVASLYDRNNLHQIITKACKQIFVPITVGGGIRTIEDIKKALDAGADKVSINTQAVKDPVFITSASKIFGKQCIVGSIEAKKKKDKWEVYIDNGRDATGLDVIEWAQNLENLGAGELLLSSVDKDGTRTGFDMDLVKQVSEHITVPLLLSGGAGSLSHIEDSCEVANLSGIVVGSMLHYDMATISDIKKTMINNQVEVRQ